MNVQQNVSLAAYSTMGLGGPAASLAEVTDRDEVAEAYAWAKDRNLPVLMIGGGSNIIWKDEGFPGLIIVNKISGYDVSQEGDSFYLTIGGGENWDSVCERSVSAGLTGIEALSLVPGSAGATPVQNVGAYGQEIAQTLVSVEAFDTQTKQFVTIAGTDCGFSYRNSRFKSEDQSRFLIISILLKLKKDNPAPPFYASVQTYFDDHAISAYTPAALRAAVIAIRQGKLPDPAVVRNCGSFFHNPVVGYQQLEELSQRYGAVPHWAFGQDQVKLSAAWLIEQAGFKDFHDQATGMATWPRQPLVLINEAAKTTADLLAFKQKILNTVQQQFGISLQQEPELLP
jgi:UDP-N-acetylmuramate dehydrogenase